MGPALPGFFPTTGRRRLDAGDRHIICDSDGRPGGRPSFWARTRSPETERKIMTSDSDPIVITGMGAVSPLGVGVDALGRA